MTNGVVFGAAGTDATAIPINDPLEAVEAICSETALATESAAFGLATGMNASTVIEAPETERMISSGSTAAPLDEAAAARASL